jgi:hypothetical protein
MSVREALDSAVKEVQARDEKGRFAKEEEKPEKATRASHFEPAEKADATATSVAVEPSSDAKPAEHKAARPCRLDGQVETGFHVRTRPHLMRTHPPGGYPPRASAAELSSSALADQGSVPQSCPRPACELQLRTGKTDRSELAK